MKWEVWIVGGGGEDSPVLAEFALQDLAVVGHCFLGLGACVVLLLGFFGAGLWGGGRGGCGGGWGGGVEGAG